MSYTYDYPRPAVSADCVVFGRDGDHRNILLIQRANDPYKGCWALPGGFLEMDEDLETCAQRELCEETGITGVQMCQLGAFGKVDRDPRGRVISIAFAGEVELAEVDAKAGSDAACLQWFPISDLPQLAFDHFEIIKTATEYYAAPRRT